MKAIDEIITRLRALGRTQGADDKRAILLMLAADLDKANNQAEYQIKFWKGQSEKWIATYQRALQQIENCYEVTEPGKDHGGFDSLLENYIHQIHKRDVKIAKEKP